MRDARIRCPSAHYLCLACHAEICSRGTGTCAANKSGEHGPLTMLRSVEEQEREAANG